VIVKLTVKEGIKMPSISVNTNHLLQIILMVLHMANLIAPQVPEQYKIPVAAVLSLLNWLVSYLGHMSNPDGTAIAKPPSA
jgi:hypothetical protein